MPIPKNIERDHILQALDYINEHGTPEEREATKFYLKYEEKSYSPKYVVSVANIFANGEELSPSEFSGGDEANGFLNNLGFTIVEKLDTTVESQNLNNSLHVPTLEPVNRSREYQSYEDLIRDKVVYEYLFISRTHRWLDEHVLGVNPDESRGYQAMGILHFIGIKDKHKGIFKDLSIYEAIQLLEQQNTDFALVIQSLRRYELRGNVDVNEYDQFTDQTVIELEQLLTTEAENIEITETEKDQVVKSRIGQSAFKKALLAIEKKCRLCGVSDERFLVASHIKPWSQSNNQERLDVNNGLLLCPNHDALFDKGYISFDDDGTILISDSLDEASRVFLNVNETMKIRMNEGQKIYMEWHRENIFKC